MQAARLLHGALVPPAGNHAVQRNGVRGVEAEGVEVRAPDPVLLHHLVGAPGPQPQLQVLVPEIELVLPVDHGPLVQPEAAELGRPRGSPGQDDPCELQCLPALPQEGVDVDRHRRRLRRQPGGREFCGVGRAVILPPGPRLSLGAGEHDAGARVPAQQLTGLLGVVGEEEVLHRVLPAGGAPLEVGVRVAADMLDVGGLARQPFFLLEVQGLSSPRRMSPEHLWRRSRRRFHSRLSG
ncbi:hypothetical protein SRABI128_06233 [Microbacterium sp. Bi128]|nr:hypothetical protein SRABI128_06233 [Microbacterium sp. Bi128]